MAIEIRAIAQQQQSHLQTSSSRQIRADLSQAQPKPVVANSPPDKSDAPTPTLSEESNEAGYERPLPPKLALLKMLVEEISGKKIELNFGELNYGSGSNAAKLSQSSAASTDQVTIDGQVFSREQALVVSDFFHLEQSMHYQMQGEFVKDGETLNLSLDLSKYYQYTRVSQRQTTAAELVDPLLIQYGNAAIGDIRNTATLDVDGDGNKDQLAMFNGDVGYLVYDKNKNSKADDGSELFGPQNQNGFAELEAYDDNQDGFIDKDDSIYQELYLWQQQGNQNYWRSLKDAGVDAIYLKPVETQFNFYDDEQQVQARISKTSFVITNDNQARAAHQIDLRL